MGQRNDEFRKKFNELDKICRSKYHMFTDSKGKYISKSAIYKFADSLPDREKNSLKNIVSLRNLVEHNDCAEVNYNIIKELDTFIALAKGKYNLRNSNSFELVSYVNHNVSKMQNEVRDLSSDYYDVPYQIIHKIEDELNILIDQLKNSKDLNQAKTIVRRFYNKIDNLDDHPALLANELKIARKEAIENIQDSLNEALSELFNPIKKYKVKEIAKRYIQQIQECNDVSRIEDLESYACNDIEEYIG